MEKEPDGIGHKLKKYMMRKKTLLSSLFATLLAVLMLTGCSETQNISYFQDYGPGFSETVLSLSPSLSSLATNSPSS